jgi:hypothetical protein
MFVANAALFYRNQHWVRNLLYTIYSVFEAHRFAERFPVSENPRLLYGAYVFH